MVFRLQEFDKLNKKKLLECIYCSSKNIEKTIMSPMISNKSSSNDVSPALDQKLKNEKEKLLKLRSVIEKNFEFVGDQFSKKVREVYYDKKKRQRYLWNNNTRRKRGTRRRRNRFNKHPLDKQR